LNAGTSSGSQQKERRSGIGGAVSPLESILQRVMIIGEICAFRDMLFLALNEVLKQRTPFLMQSLASLVDSAVDEVQKIVSLSFFTKKNLIKNSNFY
jgi:hypothetical protein